MNFDLNMLLHPTEMNIQLVQVLQKSSQRRAFGHLGKSVDILGEALATVTELTIGAGDISVGVVDVAGEENAGVDLAPVGSHLLAVLAASIEVGHLIGSENVMHILSQFGLQWSHHGELLTHENLGKQFMCTSEDHSLLLEVFDKGSLREELRHITHLMACFAGEHFAGTRENGGAHEHGHVGQVGDEFLHQREVLRAVVLGRHVDLQERDINITQVIVVALVRVADEQFALRVVVFQPVFQGSAYEATSDNSNVNHLFVNILNCFYLLIITICFSF